MRLTSNLSAAFRGDRLLLLAIFFLLLAAFSPWPGQAVPPRDFILVVDVTRSHGPRDQVLLSALAKADRWPRASESKQCQVYAWGEGMSELFRGSWPLSRETRDRVVRVGADLPAGFSDRGDHAPLHQVLKTLESRAASAVVLVFSDGRFSRESWEASLRDYEGSVEIHDGGPALAEAPDLRLRLIGRTTPIPAGEVTALSFTVEGSGVADRLVIVEAGDRRVPLRLDEGGRASIVLPVQGHGDHVVVRVSDSFGPDGDPKNDTLRIPVRDPNHIRVGVMGQDQAAVQNALRDRPRFTIVEASSLVSPCDVLCLANAPFAGDVATNESLQRELLMRIHEGRGLLILGGDAAYLPGGYRSAPLGEALPLLSGRRSNRLVQVLLDHSGSMDRDDRYGRSLAALDHLVLAMGDGDRIQVHLFSGEVLPPIPPSPIAPKSFAVQAREELRQRAPTGPTRFSKLLPTLLALSGVTDRERVVLCLTDLMDPDLLDPEQVDLRRSLSDALKALGGSFQLLLLDPTDESRDLARELGVRLTPVNQVTPRVFLEAAESDGFLPEAVEASVVGPMPLREGPLRFTGRNATTQRDQATLHWIDQHSNPLLASRRLGLGMVVAAALDAREVAQDRPLLEGLLRAVAAPANSEWEFQEIDGQWLLAGPGGSEQLFLQAGSQRYPLGEVAPGLYEGAPPGVRTGQVQTESGTVVAGVRSIPTVDPEYEFPRIEDPRQLSSGRPLSPRERKPFLWLLLALVSYSVWMVLTGTRRSLPSTPRGHA